MTLNYNFPLLIKSYTSTTKFSNYPDTNVLLKPTPYWAIKSENRGERCNTININVDAYSESMDVTTTREQVRVDEVQVAKDRRG